MGCDYLVLVLISLILFLFMKHASNFVPESILLLTRSDIRILLHIAFYSYKIWSRLRFCVVLFLYYLFLLLTIIRFLRIRILFLACGLEVGGDGAISFSMSDEYYFHHVLHSSIVIGFCFLVLLFFS